MGDLDFRAGSLGWDKGNVRGRDRIQVERADRRGGFGKTKSWVKPEGECRCIVKRLLRAKRGMGIIMVVGW